MPEERGETEEDDEMQLSGTRRLVVVLLIQPGKRVKMLEDSSPALNLELVIVLHLALADNVGRIITSLAKKKKNIGRPLDAKNKVKMDMGASIAIAEHPKFK